MLKRLALLAAAASLFAAPPATAQDPAADYPNKPVRIIVANPAGGGVDTVTRIVAEKLHQRMGQPFVVENRGGAGGSLGTGYAARQKPDGYTVLMAATGYVVNPSLYEKVYYDPLKDFDPIAEVTTFPVIYTVRPDLGVKTMQELIAYAKKRAGGLNYSTPGAGTLPHLAAELLKLNTGIEMVHIPYAGAAPAAGALLSKTVDVASISISVAKPQIDAGNFIGLAVSGGERWPELPNVPTIVEAGVPAALADTWQGLMVPAGTPKDIIDRLARATIEVVRRQDVRDRLLKAGFHATGRGPEDFRKRIVEEVPRWKDVIQRARITAR